MSRKVISKAHPPCISKAGICGSSRRALTKNLQDPGIRHEIGNGTSSLPAKGKGKASITSTTVTTPTSSHLVRTSSPLAAQTAMTTPDAQGSFLEDPNKAFIPSMLPLPTPALDASTMPEHGQLTGAENPSAIVSVNHATLSNFADAVRFFSMGKTDFWKEECNIHVEQVTASRKIHTNIQCTGKESGIKLRHEGESIPHAVRKPSSLLPQYGGPHLPIRTPSIRAAISVSNVPSHSWARKTCTNVLPCRLKKDA